MAFKLFQIKAIPSLPVSIRLFCFFLSSISFAYTAWNQNFSWKLCKHTANNNYLRIYSPPITCNLHLKSVKWVKMSCWTQLNKTFRVSKINGKAIGRGENKTQKKKYQEKETTLNEFSIFQVIHATSRCQRCMRRDSMNGKINVKCV